MAPNGPDSGVSGFLCGVWSCLVLGEQGFGAFTCVLFAEWASDLSVCCTPCQQAAPMLHVVEPT